MFHLRWKVYYVFVWDANVVFMDQCRDFNGCITKQPKVEEFSQLCCHQRSVVDVRDLQNRWCVSQHWIPGQSFTSRTLQNTVFCKYLVRPSIRCRVKDGSQKKTVLSVWDGRSSSRSGALGGGQVSVDLLTSLHILPLLFFLRCYFGSSKMRLIFGWGGGTCCIFSGLNVVWKNLIFSLFFCLCQPRKKKVIIIIKWANIQNKLWLTGE